MTDAGDAPEGQLYRYRVILCSGMTAGGKLIAPYCPLQLVPLKGGVGTDPDQVSGVIVVAGMACSLHCDALIADDFSPSQRT